MSAVVVPIGDGVGVAEAGIAGGIVASGVGAITTALPTFGEGAGRSEFVGIKLTTTSPTPTTAVAASAATDLVTRTR